MPVVPGNAIQQRLARQAAMAKRPSQLGRSVIAVEILRAFDADQFDQDGVPEEIAHLVLNEPGTMFAKVRAVRGGEIYWVPFEAAEADILCNHGNAVHLKGRRGTIIYNGLRPEEGRLVLTGDSNKPLRGSGSTNVFDVVSFIG